MDTKHLRDAALALPEGDRADLAHQLLRSLDAESDADAESAWTTEIQRRADELAAGSVHAVDWDRARERIRDRLRKRNP